MIRQFVTILSLAAAVGLTVYGQTPSITAVLDAATSTANIAQGGIFIVKGTNLSGSGYVQGSAPLSTSLPGTGVKITFTPVGGGTSKDAFMFYVYNQGGVNQLAALAPSALSTGDYNVTVTYNGALSAPFQTTVVARKFRLLTLDATGTGSVVAQNVVSATQYDRNQFTTGSLVGTSPPYTFSPAQPGQIVILWGTGLGKISGDDSLAPGQVDFRTQVDIKITIGTKTFSPDIYAGRAPTLPGADVIYFTLPADVVTGCVVPLQVTVGGEPGNPTAIAIAPKGAGACTLPGFSTSFLASLDQGGTITAGSFTLAQISTTVSEPGMGSLASKMEQAYGAFSKYAGPQLANAAAFLNPTDSCQVFHRVGDQSAILVGATNANLDAGTITLSGPNALSKALTESSDNFYSVNLGTTVTLPPGVVLPPGTGINTTPVITQGLYRLTGVGGKDVGPFTASVNIGSPLTLSADLPATVNRSQNLTIAWSGGNPTDIVEIMGYQGYVVGGSSPNQIYDANVFVCTTTADKKAFTVPSSVLLQLPLTPAGKEGSGALMVFGATQPTSTNGMFTAPLVKGGNIDSGIFQGTVGFMSNTAFQ